MVERITPCKPLKDVLNLRDIILVVMGLSQSGKKLQKLVFVVKICIFELFQKF
jgi:hypothetical protein